MTKQKDLKRLIRARMEKTGEAYTAARTHLLSKRTPPEADFAALAGMSDDAVSKKTGRSWKDWVKELDALEAITLSHRDIARHVLDHYDVTAWWAQEITVGYERIRGLRDKGQRREGHLAGLYEISKSKTFPVSVSTLYAAFQDEKQRELWLTEPGVEVRTSRKDKSIGFNWPDGTRVGGWFVSKGDAKSSVQVTHAALPNKEIGEELRAYWAERLAALAAVLEKS